MSIVSAGPTPHTSPWSIASRALRATAASSAARSLFSAGRKRLRRGSETSMGSKRSRLTDTVETTEYGSRAFWGESHRPWPMAIYRHIRELPVLVRNSTATNTYTTATAGVQAFADLKAVYSLTDLTSMADDITAFQPDTSPSNPQTSSYFLRDAIGEIMLTNTTNSVPCRMYVAAATPRKSLTAALSPALSVASGYTDASATNGQNVVGATPFVSQDFTQNWKIKKIWDVILMAGSTFVLRYRMKRNRLLTESDIDALGLQASEFVEGWTTAFFIWFHGFPVENSGATEATTGLVKLLNVTKNSYRFTYTENNHGDINSTNVLVTTTAATAINPEEGEAGSTAVL